MDWKKVKWDYNKRCIIHVLEIQPFIEARVWRDMAGYTITVEFNGGYYRGWKKTLKAAKNRAEAVIAMHEGD